MDIIKRIKNIDPYSIYKTKFLTKTEQVQFKNTFKDLVTLDGGYEEAERKRAYFNIEKKDIVCFKIDYNNKYLSLTHQNILGTLLSFNINREMIGDILANEAVFFVCDEITPILLHEFTEINHHPISLSIIDGSTFKRNENVEENTCTIDSLRLDLVVSRMTNLKRKDAQIMIENDLVQINHKTVTKSSKLVSELDIISIRRHGRFKVINTQKRSKKGKIILIYGKFI